MNAAAGILQGNVGSIQHIGIPVRDLATTKAWYGNLLGFDLLHETRLQDEAGEVEVAFLNTGDTTLEFYQVPGKVGEEMASRPDGHIDHLAFRVADVEQAFSDVKAAGFEPLEDAPVELTTFFERGVKYFNLRGPDGEKVEFNQML